MARRVKDARLDTRAARAKLAVQGEPHWRLISQGRHLGFYKGRRGGTWVARFRPPSGGAYVKTTLGKVDDTEDADGVTVLNFSQATEAARAWFAQQLEPVIAAAAPYNVADAVAAYVEFLTGRNRRGADDARRRLAYHLGKLAKRPVGDLDQEEIERWHRSMIRTDEADPDAERRSKDSANRTLTMLKAALNRCYADPRKRRERGIVSADAWREAKPFKNVGRSRQVHLDPTQIRRLLNVTAGAFHNLVVATLLTGARPAPGELAQAKVRDFHPDLHTLTIEHSKTGPREVTLTAEAVKFFEGIAAGKAPDALLLPKDDGSAWGASHQIRPMAAAVKAAHLPADTCMYSLRHTAASQAILAGMNLKLLSENMGTSIRMLETHYGKFLSASRRKLIEEHSLKLGLPDNNIEPLRSVS